MALLSRTAFRKLREGLGRRRGWVRCLVVCLGLTGGGPVTSAEEITAPAEQVQAAFLYNFAKLVEWPTNTFVNAESPLLIGVMGRDSLWRAVEETLTWKQAQGRSLRTERVRTVAEASRCQILFLTESELKRHPTFLKELATKPVLTVSDAKNFRAVGIIGLVKTNDTYQLEINVAAARQANLELSSKLLRFDRSLYPRATTPATNTVNPAGK